MLGTLGVRSACRKTVTLAFNNQVGASCDVACAAGSGRSIEEDTRMHKAAKMSAALSNRRT